MISAADKVIDNPSIDLKTALTQQKTGTILAATLGTAGVTGLVAATGATTVSSGIATIIAATATGATAATAATVSTPIGWVVGGAALLLGGGVVIKNMISLFPYKDKLDALYSELQLKTEQYRLSSENETKDYVLFGALSGKYYKSGGLMILGRSTNGWYRYVPTKQGPFEGSEPILDFPEQLTKLRHDNTNSRLWQVLNSLCTNLLGSNWEQRIVYSNYCKIAPSEEAENNGTPPKQLVKLQENICNEILKIEIESFQPRHIIAFTGCKIENIDFSERLMPALNRIYTKNKNANLSEWPILIDEFTWGNKYGIEVYKIENTIIYLTEHPDRKEVLSHVEALSTMIMKYVGTELRGN